MSGSTTAPSARILDGRAASAVVEEALRTEVASLAARGRTPGLVVVTVGDDPASKAYVGQKEKAALRIGIHFERVRMPADTPEGELLGTVTGLNRKSDIHGIIVQLPLPKHLSARTAAETIVPAKDVDCLNPDSYGRFLTGASPIGPCTPVGVMELLRANGIVLAGKRAVVVGRSHLVGRPLAALLTDADATVTIAHSRTPDLAAVCREADVLCAAVGKPGLIGRAHVKPGAVVVDVGITRAPDGKLRGDVDADSVMDIASWISPVPGGVGPMTVAILMRNTVIACRQAV